MPTEVLNPFAAIVRNAALRPAEGPAALMARRFKGASQRLVVLADCSGSMEESVGSLGMSKYEHLKIALADLLLSTPNVQLIAFGSYAKTVVTAAELPKPCGGTALAKALRLAGDSLPRKTIIITDGCPDNENDAMDAAAGITGSIDSIYCGPEMHPAVEFLRRLCRACGGRNVVWDGTSSREIGMGEQIRGLLT